MNSTTGALKSSWTPLKKGSVANEQLFEERRALLFKWWQKWSNEQRVVILHDLLDNSRNEQKQFAEMHLRNTFPARQMDFTRVLPRHLSLYIFSFLDPRSLCRCSQVCWFWKYLTEEDALWMVKSLRFGWDLGFKPTPFETGIWKRNYIQKVEDLILNNPRYLKWKNDQKRRSRYSDPEPSGNKRKPTDPKTGKSPNEESPSPNRNNRRSTLGSSTWDPPPWRANDRHPNDLVRYNFLANDDSDKSPYLFADRKEKAMQMKREEAMRRSMSGINIPVGFTLSTTTVTATLTNKQQQQPQMSSPPLNKSTSGAARTTVNQSVSGSLRPQSSPMKSILRNSISTNTPNQPQTLPSQTETSTRTIGLVNPNYEPAERENSADSSPQAAKLNLETPMNSLSFSSRTPVFGLPVGESGDDPRSKLKAPASMQSKTITRSNRDLPSHDLFPIKPWKLADAEDSD